MITIVKDLRPALGSCRDQGSRPTCIAFAASDAHAAGRHSPFVPLSVEYLFYHAVHRATHPDPNRGVSLRNIAEALMSDGQPLDSDWPYLPTLPSPISLWTPPHPVVSFRTSLAMAGDTPSHIIDSINNDKAVLVCLTLSEAFYRPDKNAIIERVSQDPDTGHHAVVALGHGTYLGERMILVRNSWGPSWGGEGHGWLYEDYIETRISTLSIAG
jgi:hypothetical protein